mmetsp:Transcript_23713/g.35876  ORF Transcript_23713/g.35876 Transcript_23713/m.35876 type:complete len:240 (+) Transcript_23713:3435-4154(+)
MLNLLGDKEANNQVPKRPKSQNQNPSQLQLSRRSNSKPLKQNLLEKNLSLHSVAKMMTPTPVQMEKLSPPKRSNLLQQRRISILGMALVMHKKMIATTTRTSVMVDLERIGVCRLVNLLLPKRIQRTRTRTIGVPLENKLKFRRKKMLSARLARQSYERKPNRPKISVWLMRLQEGKKFALNARKRLQLKHVCVSKRRRKLRKRRRPLVMLLKLNLKMSNKQFTWMSSETLCSSLKTST